jgi:hypothetical protein
MKDVLSLSLKLQKSSITIEDTEYFIAPDSNNHIGTDSERDVTGNYYRTGTYNIFLSSESKDFGYKIFLKHAWRHRERLVLGVDAIPILQNAINNNQKINDPAGEYVAHDLFPWRRTPPEDPATLVPKAAIERIHYLHKELHKRGFAADSLNIINFNDGQLFGLKVQKIQGEIGYGETLEWCYNRRRGGRRVKWNRHHCNFFHKLADAYADLKILSPRGCWLGHADWSAGNFITNEEDGKPYLIDIDWRYAIDM